MEEAFRYEDNILVEEYVKGREFSVAVLDGEALPVIEIEPLEGFMTTRISTMAQQRKRVRQIFRQIVAPEMHALAR